MTYGMRLCGVAILTVLAGACDDSDAQKNPVDAGAKGVDAAPPKVMSGVDGTKPLNMLTPAESQKLCEATSAYARAALRRDETEALACKLAGVLAFEGMDPRAACVAATAACLALPSAPPDAGAGEGTCTLPPSTCTATVAQYEACVNDTPMAIPRLTQAIPTCDQLTPDTNPLLTAGLLFAQLSPTCQVLAATCSGALGGLPGLPPLGTGMGGR